MEIVSGTGQVAVRHLEAEGFADDVGDLLRDVLDPYYRERRLGA